MADYKNIGLHEAKGAQQITDALDAVVKKWEPATKFDINGWLRNSGIFLEATPDLELIAEAAPQPPYNVSITPKAGNIKTIYAGSLADKRGLTAVLRTTENYITIGGMVVVESGKKKGGLQTVMDALEKKEEPERFPIFFEIRYTSQQTPTQ